MKVGDKGEADNGGDSPRIASLMIYCGATGSLAIIGANAFDIQMFARPLIDNMSVSSWQLYMPLLAVLVTDALLFRPRPHGKGNMVSRSLTEDLDSPAISNIIRSTLTLCQLVAFTGGGFRKADPYDLPKEFAFASLRDTTREMLQRGFFLHFLFNELLELGYQSNLEVVNESSAAAIAGTLMTLALLSAVLSESRGTQIYTARLLATVKLLKSTDEVEDDLIREWRMIKEFETAPKTVQAKSAYYLTLARGLLKITALNAVFICSHFDLFSSLALAIVSDLALIVYCKIGRGDFPHQIFIPDKVNKSL